MTISSIDSTLSELEDECPRTLKSTDCVLKYLLLVGIVDDMSLVVQDWGSHTFVIVSCLTIMRSLRINRNEPAERNAYSNKLDNNHN
jgi:hypothetical protein